MIIEIEPESIQLTSVRDGVRSTKQTNLRSIQEVLTKDKAMETPLLPSQWGTQLYKRSNDREMYVVSTAPHIRTVSYDMRGDDGTGRKEFEVPLPGFLWIFIVQNRPGSEQRTYIHGMVYAIKNQILSPKDPLYRFPFSNVDNRWMCWGDQPAPQLGAPKSIMMIPDHFLSMNFNSHLDRHKFNPFDAEINGREVNLFRTLHLFRYMDEQLKKAKEEDKTIGFKNDCLVHECTLQDAIDRFTHDFLG